MRRKEKNDLLKRMAAALDSTLENSQGLSIEQKATIVGLLRECDQEMPHFVTPSSPRKYIKLLTEGKLNLSVIEQR